MRPILATLCLAIGGSIATAQTTTREERLIDHAEYCLVNDIIVSSLPAAENVARGHVTCRAGELGLAFIGEQSSQLSIEALAKLRRYTLDGALGESYTCYVLSKGDKVLALIKRQDLQSERKVCESEVAHRIGELGLAQKDVPIGAVCAAPADVSGWIRDMSAAVQAHRKCNSEDW